MSGDIGALGARFQSKRREKVRPCLLNALDSEHMLVDGEIELPKTDETVKHAARGMNMLLCYVDESEDAGAFVMGGYLASEEKWADFTVEWQRALNKMFKGEPFHMVEAAGLWSEELQRMRVGYLYDIIQSHVQFGFALALDPTVLKRVMAGADPRCSIPYQFMFYVLIDFIMAHKDQLGDDKIKFIFDRGRQTKEFRENWNSFMSMAPTYALERIVGEPEFRDDKTTLPLQAADMKAWWARQNFNEKFHGAAHKTPMRNPRKDIQPAPAKSHAFDEEALRRIRKKMDGPQAEIEIVHGPDGIRINLGGGASFGLMPRQP